MKIIITAAGLGKRFINTGIKIPKYQIKVKNKSLFTWSLLSLKCFFDNEFILIFNKNNYDKNFIDNEMLNLGIKKYRTIVLEDVTDGQATTAIHASKYLTNDDHVIIYNIDTGIKSGVINKKSFSHDGTITTAVASGDHWSFAKLGKNGFVIETSEKVRISKYCSIGAYYFKKWGDFKSIYKTFIKDIKQKYKEAYIAPMYQYLINDGKKITIFNMKLKDIMPMGTPEEIKKIDSNWRVKNKLSEHD